MAVDPHRPGAVYRLGQPGAPQPESKQCGAAAQSPTLAPEGAAAPQSPTMKATHPSSVSSDKSDMKVIRRILDRRRHPTAGLQYLVHWSYHRRFSNCWVNASALNSAATAHAKTKDWRDRRVGSTHPRFRRHRRTDHPTWHARYYLEGVGAGNWEDDSRATPWWEKDPSSWDSAPSGDDDADVRDGSAVLSSLGRGFG